MKTFAAAAFAAIILAACGGDAPDTSGGASLDDSFECSAEAMAKAEPGTRCGPALPGQTEQAARADMPPIPAIFDCVRETGGVLIASHRGGPAPGYPENALETMQYGYDKGIRVFEIDVAETEDGVLTLMHDRRVNRTTVGDGFMADVTWEELSGMRLKDNDGEISPYFAPRLTDVLVWAKENNAIVELDRKNTTSFANIAAAVRAADAMNNVIMISYNDEQAAEIAAIDPALMMTASARGGRDIAKLEGLGIDKTRLIAWTGTREPDSAAWNRNAMSDVESAFGTLGRPGERLDDTYAADGDLSEFQALVDDGLHMIATDIPYQVADALTVDDDTLKACGI